MKVEDIRIGVVGLGLMGSSIVAALLVAGHQVVALAPVSYDAQEAPSKIGRQLELCQQAGMIKNNPSFYLDRLTISEDYDLLGACSIVLECVIEKIEIKAEVYHKITSVVSSKTIIGSNTSAIPISVLQEKVAHPERFLGVHWAEPAFMTRFLEITCGKLTSADCADHIFTLAHHWGKEPTLLKKDIRGFITNRLMYAVYREIFHLLENNVAKQEDFDKAFRYDAGSWMTLMGLFRRMDYMGLGDYAAIIDQLFPELSNSEKVPAKMQEMVQTAAKGIHNSKGLYPYVHGEADQWDEAFASFNNEIHQLAAEYPAGKVNDYLISGKNYQ
ncbi:3-hydroxybutyryl-CoA dehydrogenase [Dyadobacter sp. CECT 9275]|uniref:3-hydroxybutyryl-CoA dehydrogenase n=2 Tax=Dyadobacter helix TaxID=2822344 RepID=A0A916JCY7_9BACT|nr:3-hydroxybutyryl-CoA dehydrogenase [Dyadobacter sp. CECT 9275]